MEAGEEVLSGRHLALQCVAASLVGPASQHGLLEARCWGSKLQYTRTRPLCQPLGNLGTLQQYAFRHS